MIKAEVVVKGDWIDIGKRTIKQNQYLDWIVVFDGQHEETFRLLEQAIKHCLEKGE